MQRILILRRAVNYKQVVVAAIQILRLFWCLLGGLLKDFPKDGLQIWFCSNAQFSSAVLAWNIQKTNIISLSIYNIKQNVHVCLSQELLPNNERHIAPYA